MKPETWAEVVTVGSELVLGQLVDTNAAYMARALSDIGVGLAYHTTVGDDRKRMSEAFQIALDRCQVVITTGGIGPTEDDLTREVWAEVLGRELCFHPELWEWIQELFKRAGFKLSPNNRRQAFIPDGAEVIPNPRGTAPAFCYETGDRIVFCLPGVPREVEPMIKEEALPRLVKKYDLGGQVIQNRVLKVYGLGESNVDAQLKEIIVSSKNPTIGLQASQFETMVRLTARAGSAEEALRLLDQGEARIQEKVGPFIFGHDKETLAGNTARLLEEKGQSLAVVDAVTRGVICSELGRAVRTDLFKGGLILDHPSPPAELCTRTRKEFEADVCLTAAGFFENERLRVEVHVSGPEAQYERSQVFGGPLPIRLTRAGTMVLFTLYRFLRGD
ncbi:MAG: CinA family nicotinamide mononucleotide deamidase-related protein [Deltaproteobacteria bacterium]|nr:CinA family nicotinamide mononucleotide deamidase-related protein [Deltaproteobacteria bacterium]